MNQQTNIDPRAYRLAYYHLLALSAHLDRGTVHLRDRNGLLLEKLDQVLVAVEDRRWPACTPTEGASGPAQGQFNEKPGT